MEESSPGREHCLGRKPPQVSRNPFGFPRWFHLPSGEVRPWSPSHACTGSSTSQHIEEILAQETEDQPLLLPSDAPTSLSR